MAWLASRGLWRMRERERKRAREKRQRRQRKRERTENKQETHFKEEKNLEENVFSFNIFVGDNLKLFAIVEVMFALCRVLSVCVALGEIWEAPFLPKESMELKDKGFARSFQFVFSFWFQVCLFLFWGVSFMLLLCCYLWGFVALCTCSMSLFYGSFLLFRNVLLVLGFCCVALFMLRLNSVLFWNPRVACFASSHEGVVVAVGFVVSFLSSGCCCVKAWRLEPRLVPKVGKVSRLWGSNKKMKQNDGWWLSRRVTVDNLLVYMPEKHTRAQSRWHVYVNLSMSYIHTYIYTYKDTYTYILSYIAWCQIGTAHSKFRKEL